MAHYAFLNENNTVIKVITGKDETDLDNLPEGYSNWENYYLDKNNINASQCLRTSYNTKQNKYRTNNNLDLSDDQSKAFRGNFAVIGGTYDETNDVFIPPKPDSENNYVLDETIWDWVLSE